MKRHFVKDPHVHEKFIDIMQEFASSMWVLIDRQKSVVTTEFHLVIPTNSLVF